VRACIIFNPVARGTKARHFRAWLDDVAAECALKPTQGAGDARRLAAEAVNEGFEIVVAAGGDGTVNEVLNGIGDVPDGFERVDLGVLPLGTVNVLARELNIPLRLDSAWAILKRSRAMQIDLGRADFFEQGQPRHRYFIQLGGAGLDARAIELVSWRLKKRIGPLAYVVAGLQALVERKPLVSVVSNGQRLDGELALLGNGKYYGGTFAIFPSAALADGRLDVCVLPRANFWTLLRIAPGLLFGGRLPEKLVRRLSAEKIELTGDSPAAFELDGEWAGKLPATFSVERQKLRIVVP
jgi:YegS/Rv2252/BmrU family lipid kinase